MSEIQSSNRSVSFTSSFSCIFNTETPALFYTNTKKQKIIKFFDGVNVQ